MTLLKDPPESNKWLGDLTGTNIKERARQDRNCRVYGFMTLAFILVWTLWFIGHRNHIAIYPSHSAHSLQPLDIVGLFGALALYSTNLSKFIAVTKGYTPVGKCELFGLFWPAFKKTFPEKNHFLWTQNGERSLRSKFSGHCHGPTSREHSRG
jgi:hypothetical protein